MTATYITIMFTWTLINSNSTTGVKYDPAYYANRAGNIASVQTVLVVALGMKNNVISLITGVGSDRLNYLHRMTARVICVLLWIHAGGRFKIGLKGDTTLHNAWMRAGLLSITAFTVLCIVSLRPIRAVGYEFFFVAHFLLVLIMLLGGYFHAAEEEMGHYLWPSLFLWALDRFVRLCRVVVFNHSYFGLKSGLGTFNATAEVAAPGFVRLTFKRPKHLHWSAGQNAFLTMPGVSTLPFESHPFTIANADISRERTEEDLVFLVNTREGFTKRLMDIAKTRGSLKVFVDGPYGAPPRLEGFHTVVLIAGGSGITFTSPLLVDLVHRARKEPSVTRNVVFVWAIRHPDHINLIYGDLLETLSNLPANLNVDARIHITGSEDSALLSSESSSVTTDTEEDEKAMSKMLRLPKTQVSQGRPDVEDILKDACSLAQGEVSVNVCGPAGLTDRVRGALRSGAASPLSILKGGPSIELFVEHFGFA
ncbi:ferric reductase [Heterobasidion irregulare TC 32-1]|uniref:ferric-chelate reductase (NADPH) n=1 Tax=Heterobasidion irregulare (strain TC 32-1) TaxID=747525 RepID=W4JXL9_HETIT|nr:ferric reductase [Heterobasidion irregulare TC 32-1]ETW78224.1 ferric reductase [Heterobasidion irregulare TC 32-1]